MITFPSVAVSHDTLSDQHYLATPDFRSFLGTSSVPILITELASVIGQYPIAFQKLESGFVPVALTDIGFNRNVYVSLEGQWQCRYVPLCLQRYPFRLMKGEAGELILGVAKDRLVSEPREGSRPLFNEDGRLNDEVQRDFDDLKKIREMHNATLESVKQLSDAGLIVEWPLTVRLKKDEEPTKIEGLYRIDPGKLLGLGGDGLAHLKNHGVLTFALSQPMSQQHVNVLVERAARLMRQEGSSKTTGQAQKKTFALSDDELISF